MMLTTSLRPFHVLDSVLASELEDMFFDAVDSVLPSSSSPSSPTMMMSGGKKKRAMFSSSPAAARGRHVQTKETSKGTLVKLNVPGLSKDDIQITLRGARPVVSKEDESKLSSISGAQLQNQEGVPTSMRIDFLQKGEQQQQQSLTIKLRRKATHDIENAKAVVADGILRVVVPKITLPVVPVPVVSRESVAERPSVDDSEVCLKFAVAGYGNKDISVELDAERERLKISGLLKDKSSQFERVVPVPRGLRAEHVTLCAVENGVLELRLRDPLAIEKRVVPVFSTSPPPLQSLPSPQAMEAQPMITGEEEKGEKKPEQEQQQQKHPEEDNRVVLMKQECPGYSAKDIECFINVDRTIEAKRGNRGVKIGIPNTIDIDSIKAYCEHGIFQVIGQTVPVAEPLSSSLAVLAPPTEEGEKQKMIQQLEDMVEEEEEEEEVHEEEERDAVLVNKREGEEEAMKA
jgi:HSP20 family molecular chaperone IbpA